MLLHRAQRVFVCWVVVLAAVLLVVPAHAQKGGGPPPAAVRIGTVDRKPVQQQRLVVGQVEPAKRSIVAAQEAGRVTEAPPEPGVAVKADQRLTRIDTRLLKIDIESRKTQVNLADAQIAERAAELETAKRSRDRIAELLKEGAARRKELEDASDQVKAAEARLSFVTFLKSRAKAELRRLETRLEQAETKAPFDGFVVRKHTEIGQWLAEGDPVAEIVMTRRVKVRLRVPQDIVTKLPGDEAVAIRIGGSEQASVSAKIFAVVPDGDPKARTFDVLFKLDNPKGLMKPGMSAAAHLPTGRKVEALTVPKDAVVSKPSGVVVFVDANGRAQPVPIRIRYAFEDRFVIEGALQPGQRVVVDGNERLFPGQLLQVIGDPAGKGKPAG